MVTRQRTLADLVRHHGRARPDTLAITVGPRTVTWGALDQRSSWLAGALSAAGVAKGDRIAFLDRNGIEHLEVLFAGAKIGAVNVAINWRLTPSEMQYIINDAGAKVLFVGADYFEHLKDFESGLCSVEKVSTLADDGSHIPYAAWLDPHFSLDHVAELSPDDVVLQLYTSGTTGLPKGVMLTNSNLDAMMDGSRDPWRFDQSSVNAVANPLFHIGGTSWILVGMAVGCHSVVFRDLDPMAMLETFERMQVTNAFLVPTLLRTLSATPGASDRDYTSMRAIIYGASPITDEALLRAMRTFRCDFIQGYGLTETTGAITVLAPDEHDPDGPRSYLLRSAGRPFPSVELRVVDVATLEDAGAGETGEVWVRSPQNMLGYWNKPEATSEAIVDGWVRTGDAGFLDADGFLFLTDRIKDMIVSGGENIYPAEVENVLASHPSVADVAVIGVPDDLWGETVKAVVVLGDQAQTEAGDLIAYARDRLAHYKCPTTVDFVAELPRNPSGKVLKRQLREPYWATSTRRVN